MNTATRRQEIISGPIGPTMLRLTAPMLMALVAIMGLGLVDSYFISFLGTEELAAIGFVMPVTSMVISVALGIGMAISSLNSKLIGAQNLDNAARLIRDGLILTVIVSVLVFALLAVFMPSIFTLIGADKSSYSLIEQYMLVWNWSILPTMLMQVCSSTFRSLGDTSTSAAIAIMVTVINLILDPLLIFGIGPFPEMGIQGAAAATLIAVLVSFMFALHKLAVKERIIQLSWPSAARFKSNTKELMEVGIPAIMANLIVPFTAVALTSIVATHGVAAVAGYGVGVRIEAVSLLVVYALSSTLPMFIGQNFGAQKLSRVRQSISLCFKFVLVFQIVVYLVLVVLSQTIAELFSDKAEVQDVIRLYLYLVPFSFSASGLVILVNVSLNVLDKPRWALYINILRLLLFYFPFAYIGSFLDGYRGIFIGVALANICAFCLAYTYLIRALKVNNIS